MTSDQKLLTSEEKLLAVLSHGGFFLFPIIVPLLIFLLKKDSEFVRNHAREALIFHLTIVIAGYISAILAIILIGLFTAVAVVIFALVVTIIAIVKAAEGKIYHYPLTSQWAQKL
ncbi:DUF4870 domain-containing protein [Paenactinomyces guangxiensis]|uniref:DUF4870 domain-containing protein n=1 Tax=Paenactinomyces guangxiensis TaxID=1490290 RepID=A0A7W1WN81_9BACL|nr:DUF4870 domain-containing protein [Paenactinomyces guangxiensis]MBA4492945.1 DUF4870 domain-containing protein [Paenactinomyces guangxiensis]MBH8590206.1 DUF4870 domain-containing protein [Paenactinomyces guangxiensis]